MLYAANICTVPKQNDLYTLVGVNVYPIFVDCPDDAAFFELLKNTEISDFVNTQLKTKYLFDNAKMFVRVINADTGEHREFDFDIKDKFTQQQ